VHGRRGPGCDDVPLVLISVSDGPRQIYVGSHGLAKMRADEPSPACREVATTGKPSVMQDAAIVFPERSFAQWSRPVGFGDAFNRNNLMFEASCRT